MTNTISIQTYQPAQVPQMKELFVTGMSSMAPAIYRLAMFRSYLAMIFWATVALLYKFFGISYLLLVVVVAWTVGMKLYLQHIFHSYATASCDSDLSDIDGVYIKKGGLFLVATSSEEPNVVVGMVAGEIKDQHRMELRRMSVSERHQQKGIASQLIQKLEAYAKQEGIKTIFLTCTSCQYPAHALYHRNGFVIVDTKGSKFMKFILGLTVYCFEKEIA